MNATMNRTLCVDFTTSSISDLLMAMYIIAFILGLIFNLLTVWPTIRQVCSKNVLGVYLLSLSISDLLYILTMPLWIYYYHKGHKWTLNPALCKLAGFFYYSNMYTSIYFLCCISIDRCLVVTFPLRVKAFRHCRYAWLICCLICIIVMSLHSVVLEADKQTAVLNPEQRCYETYPLTERLSFFNFMRVGIGFLLPLLIILVCYFQILRKVQKSPGVEEQDKRKVKLLSLGVVAIFSICFAPYHILLLVRSIVFDSMDHLKYCHFEQAQHLYFSFTLALSSLNSVVDPVLYVLVSNGIREDLWLCWRNRLMFWRTQNVLDITKYRTKTDPTFLETA